jgi:hypothetical protein
MAQRGSRLRSPRFGIFIYLGTSGAACYSHDGEPRWQMKLGNGIHDWGSASSPILFEDLLIVHNDAKMQRTGSIVSPRFQAPAA